MMNQSSYILRSKVLIGLNTSETPSSLGYLATTNQVLRNAKSRTAFALFAGQTKSRASSLRSMPKDLPGFYWDADRSRYFPLSHKPKNIRDLSTRTRASAQLDPDETTATRNELRDHHSRVNRSPELRGSLRYIDVNRLRQ
jgi:hypothetical protein